MTERSAERRVRQETGWLAGRPLLRVPTIRHTTDTFLFISHTSNVLLFKSHYNIVIGVRIIKELPGLVGSGTTCTRETAKVSMLFFPDISCVSFQHDRCFIAQNISLQAFDPVSECSPLGLNFHPCYIALHIILPSIFRSS
jgi:hypothetical protein